MNAYVGELFLVLASIGLSNPLLKFLLGEAKAAEPATQSPLGYLLESRLGIIGVIALVIWLMVKVYVRRENLEKRCSLITSFISQSGQIELSVRSALSGPDPMPALNDVKLKLDDLVARNVAEGVFTQGVFAQYRGEADALCDSLVQDFSDYWAPPPPDDQRPGHRRPPQDSGDQP
ncbi:hypothetical protein JI752_006815 [Lysobacter sp. MMG2]|uniref:hypothetical protein n=1 Tax=Lysobacter sp. MMG2 TaxID=2801338 RepID=UPI001C22DE17|nr:hypothetical protein [Lysobacter sp. MMG2]MBU8975851.1 hypothetical protein [Lysobacter sp. MMG2]